jgi:hypothetical protein
VEGGRREKCFAIISIKKMSVWEPAQFINVTRISVPICETGIRKENQAKLVLNPGRLANTVSNKTDEQTVITI